MTGIVVAFLTAAEAQPRDLISDAATALKVGIAILEAYYSEKLVRDWEPFKAVIIDDYWSVSPDRYRPLGLMGGSDPYIEISKKDARVLRMVSIDSRTARAPSPHPSPLRGEGVVCCSALLNGTLLVVCCALFHATARLATGAAFGRRPSKWQIA